MNTFSRAAQVNAGIADEHGDGRDDLEVDEGFDAETAHFLQVGVPGNADNEDSEQQGRDDDLDEPEKDGAEELQVDRDRGPVLPKLRAGEKPDSNEVRNGGATRGEEKGEFLSARKRPAPKPASSTSVKRMPLEEAERKTANFQVGTKCSDQKCRGKRQTARSPREVQIL